jgi:hypothetical protein
MQLQKYFLFLLLIGTTVIQGQTIKGKITTTDNIVVQVANIIIKDSVTSKAIKEFTFARNGSYEILLKKEYKSIYIEISANNYSKASYSILNLEKDKTYIFDFLLNKDNIINLQEVKIAVKKTAFTQVNDTTKFNVSSYKDGADRKIQDVIRKMPGMEVNDKTGEIKYKGTSIETVQVDGDDLFSGNYTTATKNINVGIIEQVQAIENFSNNKLLKGLERDGKIALNLKLKKNITDVSGSINSALGMFNEKKVATDSDANFLSISSKTKSFGTLSFNNIALNYSPFDYFGNTNNKKETENLNFKSRKIIQEYSFLNILDNNRTVLNNSIFGNYNISFTKNKNFSMKSNLYFVKDAISSINFNEANNTITNQNFTTSDRNNSSKNPLLLRADFNNKYFLTSLSLIEYDLLVSKEKINSISQLIQNSSTSFKTDLMSDDLFIKSKFNFTKKISDNKAFQFISQQTFDGLNQLYTIKPEELSTIALNAKQDIKSKKTFIDFQGSIIGRIKRAKYNFNLGLEYTNNILTSSLDNLNVSTFLISINKTEFSKTKMFLKNNFDYDWGNWKILSNLNFSLLNRNLKNQFQSNDLLIEPEINFKYKFNRISTLNLGFSSVVNSQSDNYIFSNNILISNRTTIKNTPSLNFQKSANYTFNYNLYDLSKQFQINFGLNYTDNIGDFFSDITINQNNTQIEYFFLNEKFSNLNFNFMIDKYLPIIQSTVKLKTNYGISNYKNFINNSDLRDNKNYNFVGELFLGSAFDGKFNFQNTLKFNTRTTLNSENNSFSNKNYCNSFKLLYRPSKKWLADVIFDHFVTNQNIKYNFFDFLIKYIPNDKRFTYSLVGKNLLNNQNFIEVQTSDYYTSINSSNIIPRTLLITCNYSF